MSRSLFTNDLVEIQSNSQNYDRYEGGLGIAVVIIRSKSGHRSQNRLWDILSEVFVGCEIYYTYGGDQQFVFQIDFPDSIKILTPEIISCFGELLSRKLIKAYFYGEGDQIRIAKVRSGEQMVKLFSLNMSDVCLMDATNKNSTLEEHLVSFKSEEVANKVFYVPFSVETTWRYGHPTIRVSGSVEVTLEEIRSYLSINYRDRSGKV